jgi:tetratricopeptide (TPR) repeat protein
MGQFSVEISLFAGSALSGNQQEELVVRSDYEPIIIQAVQIALTFGDDSLASRGLEKLSSQGPAGFIKGVFAFNKGNWAEAFQILSEAEIPDAEKAHVAQLLRIASLIGNEDQTDELSIDKVRQEAVSEARTLIAIANLARRRGFADAASRAYSDAVALLRPNASHADRITVASYAYFLEDYSTVIDALDGHLDQGAITPDLMQLADAHALERPTRPRNMKFYERLAPAIRNQLRFARSYASVLADRRRYSEAETVLKQAIEAFPKDAYIRLKLFDIYRRSDRDEEIRKLVLESDETSFVGPPIYTMQWSHLLRDIGEFPRALSLAYETLRTHPDDPQLALSYVGLIFGDNSHSIIPNQTKVGQGSWVLIKNDLGQSDSFIIDEGQEFFGIEVVSADQERATRLIDKKLNDSFETSDLSGQIHVWTVTEIKSKYLQVLHIVLQSFERRFPNVPGLWGFTIVEGNIQPIFDMIKARADSQRSAVEENYRKGLPLAITARSLGMDVTSLAEFIRSVKLDIVTTGGSSVECEKGVYTANDYKDTGAVLDEYTAIVAAEIGALPLLKSWFKTLSVPASVVDVLDERIARTKADLGPPQMSVGFIRGEFVKRDIDDEFRRQQITALNNIKQKIEDNCIVEPVTFPDDLDREITDLYRITGQRVLEPMFLAASRGGVLLSDDLHYRNVAAVLTKVDGTWLQAVLLAAQSQGFVARKDLTEITVGLAARRHGNLWLGSQSLAIFCHESTAEGFAELCHFIGNVGAEMSAHTVVTAQFLNILWRTRNPALNREARTSCILAALIRHRAVDWEYWIAHIWIEGNHYLKKYILAWLVGHFLPTQPVNHAIEEWSLFRARHAVAGRRTPVKRRVRARSIKS